VAANISEKDLLRFRLESQLIEGSEAISVVDVAERMLAVQAQDLAAAGWALGLRSRNSRLTDVRAALDNGSIVRSWPMRGTLHLVPAHDLGWMLSLTTARQLQSSITRRTQLGLDERTIERAREALIDALSGGRSANRAEAMALIEEKGIATTGQRGYHILWHLSQTGTLVWGPPDTGQQQSLVLSQEWIAAPRTLEHDEALGEFIYRYFDGHGPATLADFAWWSKVTLAEARTGLAVVKDRLTEVEVNGTSMWLSSRAANATRPKASRFGVHALPGFDEYLLGYRERGHILDDEFAPRIVPGNNGIFQPTIVVHGRIVGTWRRAETKRGLEIRPEPFAPTSGSDTTRFRTAAKRYARFLGLPLVE
jgi:hypothetical protein